MLFHDWKLPQQKSVRGLSWHHTNRCSKPKFKPFSWKTAARSIKMKSIPTEIIFVGLYSCNQSSKSICGISSCCVPMEVIYSKHLPITWTISSDITDTLHCSHFSSFPPLMHSNYKVFDNSRNKSWARKANIWAQQRTASNEFEPVEPESDSILTIVFIFIMRLKLFQLAGWMHWFNPL